MKTLKILIVLALLGAIAGAVVIYSGRYNIAADEPHWPVTYKLIEILRERSISAHAKGIEAPKLDEPKLIKEGAQHYAAMCSGCHLAPGMQDTEIRMGLYPPAPNLVGHEHGDGEGHAGSDDLATAVRQFWIIKHGIKMTAMPAWGTTHDDNAIWGMVAFLQKLPGMTPQEYSLLTGTSVGTGAEAEGNGHGDDGHDH